VDGVAESGHSFVDQSATGESLPIEKVPGASVFAGTINQSGALEVRTTGIGRDTTFAKIVEAVEQAQESRAPIQKTADRLSGYLVYFALGPTEAHPSDWPRVAGWERPLIEPTARPPLWRPPPRRARSCSRATERERRR
jgi:E1-E2 ATPase